jgi:hypothetical protein
VFKITKWKHIFTGLRCFLHHVTSPLLSTSVLSFHYGLREVGFAGEQLAEASLSIQSEFPLFAAEGWDG